MIGLNISVAGIHGGLRRLDVAADNIANLTTTAFKRSRVESPGDAVRVDYSRGPLELADGRFFLAIDGDGFFRVQTPQGDRFTRAGGFHVDAAGNVVTAQGFPLFPAITVPVEAVGLSVSSDGAVSATLADGQTQTLGTIEVSRFANPAGLSREGGSLLAATPSSGLPLAGGGEIVFGAVEGSNVSLEEEVVSLIIAKASVRANVAALRAQSEALGEIIDLKG